MSIDIVHFRSRLIHYLPSLSLILLALSLSVYTGQCFAQRAESDKKDERKTKHTAAMSEPVYKKLSKAQKASYCWYC